MEDELIIQYFFDRDERALRETSAKYGSLCYKVAMNVLENRQDAEECVNDTLLRTWNSIPPEHPRVFPAFLTVIARNIALDRWRKKKKQIGNAAAALDKLADYLPSPEEDRGDLPEILNSFLSELSPDERVVFVLRYWRHEPIEHIATGLSMKTGTVLSKLSRARKKLRVKLENRGYHV